MGMNANTLSVRPESSTSAADRRSRIQGMFCALTVGSTEIVEVANLADLVQIFDTEVNLCYVPRLADPAIDTYLATAAAGMGGGFRRVVSVTQGFDASGLPDLPGRQTLVNDMDFLVALYGDLLGCERVGLRLEVVSSALCPRFHVDRTGIRLLCTWRGPGTEYLVGNCANRRKLGSGAQGLADEHSGLILDTAGVGHVPPYAIALLKGDGWPGNTDRGVIHRSPAVPAATAPRVLLTLDAIWEE